MSNFRYSICEPAKPNIIEKGKIDVSEIIQTFNDFPFEKLLTDSEKLENPFFSPSIEFENLINKNALSISAVETADNFYIFYKRPKMRKTWFGLSEKMDENFTSDLLDLNKAQTLEILKALIENRLSFLEEKFK